MGGKDFKGVFSEDLLSKYIPSKLDGLESLFLLFEERKNLIVNYEKGHITIIIR